MELTAVIDRIEEGMIVLLSEEGIEISIPAEAMADSYHEGDRITLMINGR